MIVVADTSPLNYLILIDEVGVLASLFGHVLLPTAVARELSHPNAPIKVQEWMSKVPAWAEVRSVTTTTNPMLMRLDPGERKAIQLALEAGVNTVLMDESEGRKLAESFHLEVRGTLGILERGARLG